MIYQFNLSFSLSLLFMGFLLANVFGIVTNSKNVIFLFVLCIELINCFIYSTKARAKLKKSKSFFSDVSSNYLLPTLIFPNKIQFSRKSKDKNNSIDSKLSIIISIIASSLNFLKIGFEFGFFIDAFKLGS